MERRKKAFTVVELVIVFAVIAVFAAILIPTFSGVIRKAETSNDISLVRNMNTVLKTEKPDGRFETVGDAMEALRKNGFNTDEINEAMNNRRIAWNSEYGVFVYPGASDESFTEPDPGSEVETSRGEWHRPGDESESNPTNTTETIPETESEPRRQTDPETDSETDPETDHGTDPETDPETDSETDPETAPEADSETDPETDPETDSETDHETDPETDPETDHGTDSETDPETDSETVTDPGEESGYSDEPSDDPSDDGQHTPDDGSVDYSDAVACVGKTVYPTLAAALQNCPDGATVTLMKSVSTPDREYFVDSKNITLVLEEGVTFGSEDTDGRATFFLGFVEDWEMGYMAEEEMHSFAIVLQDGARMYLNQIKACGNLCISGSGIMYLNADIACESAFPAKLTVSGVAIESDIGFSDGEGAVTVGDDWEIELDHAVIHSTGAVLCCSWEGCSVTVNGGEYISTCEDGEHPAAICVSAGTVRICGGAVIHGAGSAVYLTGRGNVSIESGTFSSDGEAVVLAHVNKSSKRNKKSVCLTISGGRFFTNHADKTRVLDVRQALENGGKVLVTGGEFVGFDPATVLSGN